MRLATLTFLIIGHVLANQAHAENVSTQPLTRADCDRAEMAWDENANVCIPNSGKASGQPLTRLDCESAGLLWNDTANVCAEKSESATQTTSEEPKPVMSTVLINIDKASQKMTVFLDGAKRYEWPVSTGMRGYTTPSGTYTASSMNKIWYSKQWDNAPMPHAVFFTNDGHAIHGTYEVKRLGKPASHGCVRIAPQNAATLYTLVAKVGLKNTQVALTGYTPGGEGKVANQTKVKSSYRQTARSQQYKNYLADSAPPQRPTRGGFFRRLFGGP